MSYVVKIFNFEMLIFSPATGMARAFRNGITLDDRPKNKGVMAYLVKLEIFGKKL